MLSYLKRMDIVLSLLVLISLRSIFEINIAQSIVALGIFGLFAYNKWLERSQVPDINEELKKELENIRSHMSGLMVKNAANPNKMAQQFEEIKNSTKRFF